MGEHTKQKPPLMRRSSFWIGAIILVVLIGLQRLAGALFRVG